MYHSSLLLNIVVAKSCLTTRPNNLSLVCLYLSLYISFLLFGHFFFIFMTHRDRKHYYIKVVESIQFVCAGNFGISQVCVMQTTTGLFMKDYSSTLALHWSLKYPLRLPYIHFYFSLFHLQYKINGIHS